MATAEEFKAAAKRAAEAGDVATARKLIVRARDAEQSGKSFGTKAWENLVGDNDPTSQNFGEKVGTFLNKAGESLTFGLVGDEASAAVESAVGIGSPGIDDVVRGDNRSAYERRRDHYRGQEALFEQTNPGAALAADVGGAIAGAAIPGAGAIGTAARGAGLGKTLGTSAAVGAGMGGTYGFMEGEGIQDRLNEAQTGAALGGAAGLAAPIVGAGVQKVADNVVGNRAIRQAARGAPTTEQLRASGNALYDQIDNAGVQVKPEAFENFRKRLVDVLRKKTGFDELPGAGSLTPNTARVAQIMEEASGKMAQEPTAALPFRSLDQMRRQAGAAAGNVANKTDRQAGMTVIEQMDDFIKTLDASDVTAGDVRSLQSALPKAREVWSRMSKSQLLDDAMEKSDNYLSGGASGLRNQFKNILNNPKTARAFSAAEKKAMQRVAKGTLPEQLLYLVSGGLGNLGAIGGGLAMGGPWGALGGAAVSAGLRKGAESVASRNAEIARAVMAKGGLQQLPVATDSARRLMEATIRRAGAAAPQ